MNSWIQTVQNTLLPTQCLLCGAGGTSFTNLCTGCAAELPRLNSACRLCAAPLAHPGLCPACQRQPPPYVRARCALHYAVPVSHLVQALKFQGRLAAAEPLGGLLAAHLNRVLETRPQAIVPVPLHPARLRTRGFNQSVEIGRRVAKDLGVPLLARAAHRVRATPPQSGLGSRTERRRNVRGAFAAGPALCGLAHVAVLDDVLTTGATVSELSVVLHRAGVHQVEVWAVARAG
jgi:ComF family protein